MHPVSHGDVYELGFIKIRARILQDQTNYASPSPTSNAALDPLANHGTDQNPSVFDMIPDDSFLSNTPIEELLNSDEEIILNQVEDHVPAQSAMDDALLKEQFISPVLDDEIINEEIELEAQPSAKKQTHEQSKVDSISEGNDLYLAALSKGLGIELNDLENPEQTLFEIGAALRSSVNGIQQLLRTRTELKNKLTANATTIQAQGNNPIKFSHDVNDALNVSSFIISQATCKALRR